MTNLQTAIIYTSCIGSLLNEWHVKESNKSINDLKAQIKKFMYKRSRTNLKEFKEALQVGNKAWVATIERFKDEHLEIEAISTIIVLWSEEAEKLARFANITQKRMDSFSRNMQDHTLEVEQNAYEVAAVLIEEIENAQI